MFVRISNILSEEMLSQIDAAVAGGEFIDGAATAGAPTRGAKNNQLLQFENAEVAEEVLGGLVRAVNTHPTVRASVVPRRLSRPMITKYTAGMAYDWHIDNAVMAGMAGQMRTDVACTLFLTPSDAYDGGELVVQTATGEAHVRLERGDAFLYPATSRHRVTEVTRGERLAAVFWIQSLVADSARRELLNDLNLAYENVIRKDPESDALQFIQRAHANLVRMWSDL